MEINKESVKVFKLTTGEEIVGQLQDQDSQSILVVAPLGVAPSQSGLQLVPMMFSSDLETEVQVFLRNIVAIAPAREDMVEAYDKSLNPSDLVVPGKKQIITG